MNIVMLKSYAEQGVLGLSVTFVLLKHCLFETVLADKITLSKLSEISSQEFCRKSQTESQT